MAHWRMTPRELRKLSESDIAIMEFAYCFLERRTSEMTVDNFGALLGASWPVTMFEEDGKPEKDEGFTWSLRDRVERVSTPLSAVFGGDKFMDHVKKLASERRLSKRIMPSVLNMPSKSWTKGGKIVDLSYSSKEQFLRFAKAINSRT